MALAHIPIFTHWLDETLQLLQRLFIVVVAAYISIRINWLRQALRGAELRWYTLIFSSVIYGGLAIIGTYSSIVIDINAPWSVDLLQPIPLHLPHSHALLGFRDTMTLAAGLIGGPWVGLGTGLIAGLHRIYLGGMSGTASGFATIILGIYAGIIRYRWPQHVASVAGVFWVALFGTLIQRILLLAMVKPYDSALSLAWAVFVPVGITNIVGCVLFFWIIRDLDRDRLESEAHEARSLALLAELRALRAQVSPHFLNNTLQGLNALIRTNQNQARRYVVLLAKFFKFTRQFAEQDTLCLRQEMKQVLRYLRIQRLELGDKLQYRFIADKNSLDSAVLPGCLLTLVENALKHGFKGKAPPYQLTICAEIKQHQLCLQVTDNGHGIPPDRIANLGRQAVISSNGGSGVALQQLARCLQLIFGSSASLAFESTSGQGTIVTLKHIQRDQSCQ